MSKPKLQPAEQQPINYKLTKAEQETHTVYDRETNETTIYSSIPADIRRCKKAGYTLVSEDKWGATFVTKKKISFRNDNPKPNKRKLSDEQKQKMQEGRKTV